MYSSQNYVYDSISLYFIVEWSLLLYSIHCMIYNYVFIYSTICGYSGSFHLGAKANSAVPGLY